MLECFLLKLFRYQLQSWWRICRGTTSTGWISPIRRRALSEQSLSLGGMSVHLLAFTRLSFDNFSLDTETPVIKQKLKIKRNLEKSMCWEEYFLFREKEPTCFLKTNLVKWKSSSKALAIMILKNIFQKMDFIILTVSYHPNIYIQPPQAKMSPLISQLQKPAAENFFALHTSRCRK